VFVEGVSRQVREVLIRVGFTTLVAVVTALIQILLRNQSRPNLPGKSWSLTMEDGLFWSDWTLAGGWALASACVGASRGDRPIPMTIVLSTLAALVVGLLVVPFVLRGMAYDPATAKLRTLKPYGLGWILIANSIGMILLYLAVSAGVSVYE
jgi:hypothetical protein